MHNNIIIEQLLVPDLKINKSHPKFLILDTGTNPIYIERENIESLIDVLSLFKTKNDEKATQTLSAKRE